MFAVTAHLAAFGRTGLGPNSATEEGQKKVLYDGLLCFITIRTKLLLDKDKTVFFFFLRKGKRITVSSHITFLDKAFIWLNSCSQPHQQEGEKSTCSFKNNLQGKNIHL